MAINLTIKQEEREGEKVEMTSGLDVPSPTEAIIAFGLNGENQILRSGKNKCVENILQVFLFFLLFCVCFVFFLDISD